MSPWWVWPVAICLVHVAIHGYLGIHVIRRGVIFVDLAMAQIAALGGAFAMLLGYSPIEPADAPVVWAFSLGFTILGAAVLAITRMRHERIPQEAIIGVVYACASALAVLILTKVPHGQQQLQFMLTGNILLVKESTVWATAGLYGAVGAFHWFFRGRFLAITHDAAASERGGVNLAWWDFLFYATFGVVITSSVAVAGVLLVFTYLVGPAIIASLFADGFGRRVGIAWAAGSAVTIAGMLLSYHGNLPTGPSVVGAFAVALAGCAAAYGLRRSESRGRTALKLAGGAAAVAILLAGAAQLRKQGHDHHHHGQDDFSRWVARLHSGDEAAQIDAIHHLEEMRDEHVVPELVAELESSTRDRVREHLAEALGKLGDSRAVPSLLGEARREPDDFLKITMAEAVLDLKSPEGFRILVDVAEKGGAELARRRAREIVKSRANVRGDDLRAWWTERGSKLRWRATLGRFE